MPGADATAAVIVDRSARVATITLNRPDRRNTLTQTMLNELAQTLDTLERDETCQLIVLRGRDGYFCTGMDFAEMTERAGGGDAPAAAGDVHYMDVLRRLSTTGRVVVAHVDGQVMAGGVGLVAASDLVIATPASRFSLPEALWGLLPACVLPLLIRRIGFQPAYRLTLTTETWSAEQARGAGLVDEVTSEPDEAIRRIAVRASRLDATTVAGLKAYFKKMWYLSDAMEQIAIDEIEARVRDPRVQENIRQFVLHQTFPWDRRS